MNGRRCNSDIPPPRAWQERQRVPSQRPSMRWSSDECPWAWPRERSVPEVPDFRTTGGLEARRTEIQTGLRAHDKLCERESLLLQSGSGVRFFEKLQRKEGSRDGSQARPGGRGARRGEPHPGGRETFPPE